MKLIIRAMCLDDGGMASFLTLVLKHSDKVSFGDFMIILG